MAYQFFDLDAAASLAEVRYMDTMTAGTIAQTGRGVEWRAALKGVDTKVVFFLGLIVAASGMVSAPVALAGGVAYGFAVEHPLRQAANSVAKTLLQVSVVMLGFGMDLGQVVRVGRSGFLFTAVSIAVAVVAGLALGRGLRIGGKTAYLITMGTAICGGSAIAALAPVMEASEEETSVSLGAVFLLNSVALLLFPMVGWALHLSQSQFGLWAALAIHDTSSVVGAAARYGDQALAIGTTVKLARALWIVPVSLGTAFIYGRLARREGREAKAKVKMPWFILLFVLASVANTYVGRLAPVYGAANHLGRLGLTATLFLIGTSLSKKTLKAVGYRPLLQAVLLWVVVGCASLAAIYWHVISI
jgi:uncharacterized integral membrane protein (TIGR00698 family)